MVRPLRAVKAWRFLAKIFVTISLLCIVVIRVDMETVFSNWRSVSGLVLIVPIILMFQTIVAAFRWHLILKTLGEAPPVRISIAIFWAGVFLNSFLPAGLASDGIRVFGSRRAGSGLSSAINSVLLDRMFGVFGMMLVAGAAAPAFARLSGDSALLFAIPILAIVMALGTALLTFLDRPFVKQSQSKIFQFATLLARDVKIFYASPIASCVSLATAIFGSVSQSLAVYVIGCSLSLNLTVLDCLILVPPITLLTSVPLSIGGWGIREGAMVTLLGLVGVFPSKALALSPILGAMTVLASLPGSLALFVRLPALNVTDDIERNPCP
jgi:uncharacterized protein (TIRG00374 family)